MHCYSLAPTLVAVAVWDKHTQIPCFLPPQEAVPSGRVDWDAESDLRHSSPGFMDGPSCFFQAVVN